MLAGAGYAFYKAKNENSFDTVIEILGGIFGGNLGSQIADSIDLPTNPHHRSIAHGMIPNAMATPLFLSLLKTVQTWLGENATKYQTKANSTKSLFIELWNNFLSLLCHFGARFIAGIGIGHLSHLALDIRTPASLQIFD